MERVVVELGQRIDRATSRRDFLGAATRLLVGFGGGLISFAALSANDKALASCPCVSPCTTQCCGPCCAYGCTWCTGCTSQGCPSGCTLVYQWTCCVGGFIQRCRDCECPAKCGCQYDTEIAC